MDPKLTIIKDENSEEEKYQIHELEDDSILDSIYDSIEVLDEDIIIIENTFPEMNIVVTDDDDDE